jgi:hypothetical protein
MSKNISPIETTRALTQPWLLKIWDVDALEIHPCVVVGHDSLGGDIVEQCDPEDAHFWTVFGHFRSGGIDDFGDFASEAEATVFHDRLIAIYPHLAEEED